LQEKRKKDKRIIAFDDISFAMKANLLGLKDPVGLVPSVR